MLNKRYLVEMRKMTIKDAALFVLKQHNKPMSIDDICNIIIEDGLYDFGAKSPKSVLRIEMARASENQDYSKPYMEKLFKFKGDDIYELL